MLRRHLEPVLERGVRVDGTGAGGTGVESTVPRRGQGIHSEKGPVGVPWPVTGVSLLRSSISRFCLGHDLRPGKGLGSPLRKSTIPKRLRVSDRNYLLPPEGSRLRPPPSGTRLHPGQEGTGVSRSPPSVPTGPWCETLEHLERRDPHTLQLASGSGGHATKVRL